MTRQSAAGSALAIVGFPLGAAPDSAVSALTSSRPFAAAGCAPLPTSYRVLEFLLLLLFFAALFEVNLANNRRRWVL